MSTSPLPLQPLPISTPSAEESFALKSEVASRLAEHRRRHPSQGPASQNAITKPASKRNRALADSVAARFAASPTYRDFIAEQAAAAVAQAEATVLVAARNAQAAVAVQQQLLEEIEVAEAVATTPVLLASAAILPPDTPAVTLRHPERSEARSKDLMFEREIASTVEAPGAPLNLNFEPELIELTDTQAAQALNPWTPQTLAQLLAELKSEAPDEPATALPTNVIAFPRQLIAERKARPRLAEGPLRDEFDAAEPQLRIFEVDSAAIATLPDAPAPGVETVRPEWVNIRLDTHRAARASAAAESGLAPAIPTDAAAPSDRLMAFLVDAVCVTAAFAAVTFIAGSVAGTLPTGLLAAGAAAGTLLLLALVYQLLFFTFSDATPGMRYARISLCTFGDENPTRSAIRRRIFAVGLAGMPVGLGLLWAAWDEDRLGWHDRISRIYPRAY